MPRFYYIHLFFTRRIMNLYLLGAIVSSITKRRQRLFPEFLLVAPRQLCMFDHEEASDRCDGSQTRIENEHQLEACRVSMREHIAGHRRRQSQLCKLGCWRARPKNIRVIDDGSNCG